MEFRHLAISISLLFTLAVVGESHNGHEMVAEEDYWQAVWPNTPIPSALRELLKPGLANVPMEIDDTQYPETFFSEQELYPGKSIKVEFNKRPFAQPWGVRIWVKDVDREGYTFEEFCVNGPAKGENKYCAKSLGTLIGYSISKLGKNIQVLSSSFFDKQNEYRVEGMQSLGDRAVMCHRLNFQKVAFYCHEINDTAAFKVQLATNDGRKTQVLGICHHDTSGMNHEMLHQTKRVDPGNNPVCHFLGNKSVLWVPNSVVDDAYNSNFAI